MKMNRFSDMRVSYEWSESLLPSDGNHFLTEIFTTTTCHRHHRRPIPRELGASEDRKHSSPGQSWAVEAIEKVQ